jgi:ArsR family transcriptional regulator
MRNDRCCPVDSDMKVTWEKGLDEEIISLKNANIKAAIELLKVLSNPVRLQMILLLSKGDYCVCELVYILKEKQNLISYNLGILKRKDIVDSYNRSGDKYYKLNTNGNAIPLINYINENFINK